jgi:GntR family transcriptional regulator
VHLFNELALEGILRREVRLPLYHQLQEFLRGLIVRGEVADGEQLPREEELARRFKVSRVTVRQALQVLADDRLLVRQRGRGTRVTSSHIRTGAVPVPLKTSLDELLDNLDTLASNTQVRLLFWELAVPPTPVRVAFGSDETEQLVHCVRVRSRHGRPFGYYSSWTRTQHPDFNAERLAYGARIDLFRRCGIAFSRVQQAVSAAVVDPLAAAHLQMQAGQAVMTMERRSYDNKEQLLDLLHIQYRPDQLRYQMRLDHETNATPETAA